MSKSKKLECMKDVVTLAREVGDVRMKQSALHSGASHTAFTCRIPRDTYPDVLADMLNNDGEALVLGSSAVALTNEVSQSNVVSVIAWPGG